MVNSRVTRLLLQNTATLFIVCVQKILFPIVPYSQVHFTVSCIILSNQSIILPILISISSLCHILWLLCKSYGYIHELNILHTYSVIPLVPLSYLFEANNSNRVFQ